MTSAKSLAETIISAPGVFAPAAAQAAREALGPRFADLPAKAQDLINAAAGGSPYLRRLMQRRPDLVFSILAAPPEISLDRARVGAKSAVAAAKAEQMQILRAAKSEAALAIAFADLSGVWSVMKAAEALSYFADAAIAAALDAAIAHSALESAAGIAVLAMGKLGAFELNYSSDIDLIVLYDGERMGFADGGEAQSHAVKITRAMVDLLQA